MRVSSQRGPKVTSHAQAATQRRAAAMITVAKTLMTFFFTLAPKMKKGL
jgi:hypothetical protein